MDISRRKPPQSSRFSQPSKAIDNFDEDARFDEEARRFEAEARFAVEVSYSNNKPGSKTGTKQREGKTSSLKKQYETVKQNLEDVIKKQAEYYQEARKTEALIRAFQLANEFDIKCAEEDAEAAKVMDAEKVEIANELADAKARLAEIRKRKAGL